VIFPIASYRVALFLFENSNLLKFLPLMGDYSYCTFENGRLRMRGLHRHGFPLMLWDALVQTGYGDRAPEYYGRLYEEHGLQHYEVNVNIPSHPVYPDGSPDYWGRHGRCYGEGCSHGTHCLVLIELGCYCRHAHLIVPYPGPLRHRVEGSHG
jgi:hypothetical protein